MTPLHCPFCGHTDVQVVEGSTFRWRVAACENCGARAGEVRIQTLGEGTLEQWEIAARESALVEWNTRFVVPADSQSESAESQH